MTDDDSTQPTPAGDAQAKLDAKFASLRQGPSAEKLAIFGRLGGSSAEKAARLKAAGAMAAAHNDAMRHLVESSANHGLDNLPDIRAARASEKTAVYLGQLVDAAKAAEMRETKVFRWHVAGVVLAGIAAAGTILGFWIR